MANTDFPHGLWLITTDARKQWYDKDSTSSAILVPGDPVALETDGNVVRATGTVGTSCLGVVMALKSSTGLPVRYLGATDAGEVLVCDDPNAYYRIQDDGGGTPAETWIGMNADLTIANGDTALGLSAVELDATTPSTNPATHNIVRIVALWRGVIGDTANSWDDNAEIVVRLCDPQLRNTTGLS